MIKLSPGYGPLSGELAKAGSAPKKIYPWTALAKPECKKPMMWYLATVACYSGPLPSRQSQESH